MSAAEPSRDSLASVGQVRQHSAPARMRTLLGSCVAVTVWHPELLVAGMCHLVNARRGGGFRARPAADRPAAWFADEAVPRLLRWAMLLDRDLDRWEVKLFGGGRQFAAGPALDVPAENLDEVRHQLARYGTSPVSWHVGGTGSRMVVLDVASGGVWLHHRPRPEVADAALPLQVRRAQRSRASDVDVVDVLRRLAPERAANGDDRGDEGQPARWGVDRRGVVLRSA